MPLLFVLLLQRGQKKKKKINDCKFNALQDAPFNLKLVLSNKIKRNSWHFSLPLSTIQ